MGVVTPVPLPLGGLSHRPLAPAFATMSKPGNKVPIGNGAYLIYGFDKKPKLGTIIMKVDVYTPDGKRDTSLEVLADSGMPSMRGAHETGGSSKSRRCAWRARCPTA